MQELISFPVKFEDWNIFQEEDDRWEEYLADLALPDEEQALDFEHLLSLRRTLKEPPR